MYSSTYSSWLEIEKQKRELEKQIKGQTKSKKEIRDEICKKHGVGDYYYGHYGNTQYPRIIDDEARGLSDSFWNGIRDKMDLQVDTIVKYGGDKNKVKYNEYTYKAAIRKTPHMFDKVEKFREVLEDYRKGLNDISVQIGNAPNMQEADKLADSLRQYHDSNIDLLRGQSFKELKAFGIDLMGVEPPVNEGYVSDN